MEVIISHVNADFDAIAAMVAAQKIYPEAKLIFAGSQNQNVRDFIALHSEALNFIDIKQVDKNQIKRIIVVDTKVARRLGELEDLVYLPGAEVFTFDHHPPTKEDMKVAKDFSEATGATTTTLVKIIRDRKLSISPFEATLFALGIHEDTGSLTYPTTTYDDSETLAYLIKKKANVGMINYFLNQALTDEQHQLLEKLLETTRTVNIHGVRVMFVHTHTAGYVDGASVVVHKLGDLENTSVVFAFIEMDDRVSVIGRSCLDEVDVGEILGKLNGGGHPQAASAAVKGVSLKQLERKLTQELREHIKPPLTARQIMSKPVRTVSSRMSIRDVNKLMIRYSYTGLPVVEREKLVGMISRREVDKAAHHGLSHVPVKGFMSHQAPVVSPDTPLSELRDILTETEVGRAVVMEKKKLVGIVSRSDVLKAMHGLDYFSCKETLPASGQVSRGEIREKLKKLLPGDVQNLLRRIGRLAEKEGVSVYLVGGFVRDLLLDQPNLDVDIVVEGNGVQFAQAIVSEVGGRVRAHQKFHTAVVILPNEFHIDVASARSEFYEHPAALPEVEPTSIRQDLARRDFSINAMAIALNTLYFGRLLDFFGGQRDIYEKQIRVLHNLSFVEDPTRIFRGVRFEQRHHFHLEPQTENLLRKALNMELVGRLTNVRVRDELVQILSEDTAYQALRRLEELGALKKLHPQLKVRRGLKNLLERIEKAMERLDGYFSRSTQQWRVSLAVLLRDFSSEEVVSWCEQMRLRKVDVRIITEIVTLSRRVLKSLRSKTTLKNSRLYKLLHGLSQECLVYLYASGDQKMVRERIVFYLENLRGVRVHLTGASLVELGFRPSPYFGRVLQALLKAKLDGRIRSRQEEIEFVKKEFGRLEKE